MSKEMNTVNKIRKELNDLGLMLPGGISEQWYTCKKKGCKCMRKDKPEKHGPYHQLSFSISGKSSTMTIKPENLKEAKRFLENHKLFKKLNLELLQANVELIRKDGFPQSKKV
jgi:hypothetical protein